MGTQKTTSKTTADTLLKELSKFISVPKEGTTYNTHGIHPYAAKFIPQIPAKIIEACCNERHTILDPFCGSGTTLLEARLRGSDSVGVDINPIAVLVSKVKTTPLTNEDWDIIHQHIDSIKTKLDKKDYSEIWIPNIPRIDHWFKKKIQKDLGVIAAEIKKISDERIRNFLELVFSSIIVSVSNQESETRFAGISKRLSVDVVNTTFMRKFRRISKDVASLSEIPRVVRSSTKVYVTDSRRLSKYIPKHSIDLIVTSPPYLNSYEYYLYHKFRIYWLGFDKNTTLVDKVRDLEIGSRHRYSGTNGKSVDDFRKDMILCFRELTKVTKLGKLIFILVGDSIVRGEFVEMGKFYQEIGEEVGLHFVAKTSYKLKSVSRSFKSQQDLPARKNFEKMQHILVFQNRSNGHSLNTVKKIPSKNDLVVDEIPSNVKPGTTLFITNNKVTTHTHGLVKYPSKFIPDIPRWAISNFSEEGDVVLDPFVGSGTTMVESKLLGRNCIGLDVNPFAVLASNVKTTPLDSSMLNRALDRITTRIRDTHSINPKEFPLADFWFERKVLRKISKIYSTIQLERNQKIREFFLLILGNIIKPCSYWDEAQIKVERDQTKLLHGVPDPVALFMKKSLVGIRAMEEFSREASKDTFSFAFNCDATSIPNHVIWDDRKYRMRNFDLIVTSPPYINAINYPMFNRYELFLLGLINHDEYIAHQQCYLGTERVYAHEYSQLGYFAVRENDFEGFNRKLHTIFKREPKRAYIVKRYFDGMVESLKQMYDSLGHNGKLVLVLGSNTIKQVHIPTHEILQQCAEEIGFSTVTSFSYQIRNHRFKMARHETGKRIDVDNIIVMEKI